MLDMFNRVRNSRRHIKSSVGRASNRQALIGLSTSSGDGTIFNSEFLSGIEVGHCPSTRLFLNETYF
jgi:hypothetical protein